MSSVAFLLSLFFSHLLSYRPFHPLLLGLFWFNLQRNDKSIECCYKNVSSCILRYWPPCNWRLFSDLNGAFFPIWPAVSHVSFSNMILEQKRHQDPLWDVEKTITLQSEFFYCLWLCVILGMLLLSQEHWVIHRVSHYVKKHFSITNMNLIPLPQSKRQNSSWYWPQYQQNNILTLTHREVCIETGNTQSYWEAHEACYKALA